jgi:hypothetical protein
MESMPIIHLGLKDKIQLMLQYHSREWTSQFSDAQLALKLMTELGKHITDWKNEQAASTLPTHLYPNFKEFKAFKIPLELMAARYIIFSQIIRIRYGIGMIPSPVIEGWVRLDGSRDSCHYAVDRLSNAGDWFVARHRAVELHDCMLSEPAVGGLGLYNDTELWGKERILVHMDMRPVGVNGRKMIWVRDNGQYLYYHKPKERQRYLEVKAAMIKQEMEE